MATHVEKLGPKLAVQLLSERTESLLSGDSQRRATSAVLQRGSLRLVLRTDIRGRTVPLLIQPFYVYMHMLISTKRASEREKKKKKKKIKTESRIFQSPKFQKGFL